MISLRRGTLPCGCRDLDHPTRFVALTGGPGAGKTAVLEAVQGSLCVHLATLPEAASIVFGGGFPRLPSTSARRAGQRAIYGIQRELEVVAAGEQDIAVALCDRGTLDGLAYWPGTEESYFEAIGSSRERELARYAAVIHLRVPGAAHYDRSNALRVESSDEALAVEGRIVEAWRGHPDRSFVDSTDDFLHKIALAVGRIRDEMPRCCRAHVGVGGTDPACSPGSRAADDRGA